MDFSSVFNLIGAISDIAACSYDSSAASKVFNKIISQPTCIAPPWSNAAARAEVKTGKADDENEVLGQIDDDDDDDKLSGAEPKIEAEFKDAFDAIVSWLDCVKNVEPKVRPSAVLIGKIWTRFYFNINNVADLHKNRLNKPEAWHGVIAMHSNAAKIMRFNVLALLHAVLVEESLYHAVEDRDYLGAGLRLNPVTSVKEFEEKLRDMSAILKTSGKEWNDTNPLFFLLISCPILHPFIFPFGGVNSSSKSLKNEEGLRDLIFDIVGYELFSEDDWRALITQCDPDDSKPFDKIIKSLNSATIASVKYAESKPAEENAVLPSDIKSGKK